MILACLSIACLTWLLVPVTMQLADRRPFNCHKCLAFWLGTIYFGLTAIHLHNPLALINIPITSVLAEAIRNLMNRTTTI